jgi:BNR/Asp-box repeat
MKKADNTVCFKESPPIKFDPKVKGRIYILFGGTGSIQAKKWQARGSGLYVSNDSGKTWEFLTKPEMNSYTLSLAIDPKDSNVLYLGSGSSPLTSTESDLNQTFVTVGIVYKSIDGGKNWDELNTGWGKQTRATFLRVDPNNTNTVLMGVFQTPLGQDPNNKSATGTNMKPGLHISYDAGKTWSQLGTSTNHQLSIYNMTVSDNGEGIIFTPQQSNVSTSFYSTDGGKTFNPIPGKEILLPTFVPGSNLIAYGVREADNSSLRDELMRTVDGGKSWSVFSLTPAEMQFTLPDALKREQARPQQISFEPNNPSVMFLNGGGGKIARSTDSGLSWKLLTTWETFPKMDVIAK